VRLRRALLACALVLAFAPRGRAEGRPEAELGLETLSYRTAVTPLNRDDLLGLDRIEQILRATAGVKHAIGDARIVLRGFVERRVGSSDRTDTVLRQGYLQYGWGSGLSLRVGKQRIAWGSGFAWNPTNRLEPPKNPLNTGLEQEGVWSARMDWVPAPWAGVVLVAVKGERPSRDFPVEPPAEAQRRAAALRARFLVQDTDVALVYSGGKGQRTLVGLDIARSLGGSLSAHAEAATYRGAELGPPEDDRLFFRIATGVLYNRGDSALAAEYFYNGEGDSQLELDTYLAGLDVAARRIADPSLPPPARATAVSAYQAGVAGALSGGLGLRRHYLHASWTRNGASGRWTLALRGVAGLSDGGVAFTPGVVFAPRGDLTFHLDALVPVGPARSEYLLAPFRGAVQARVRALF
jgi:hypothetical protein